MTQLLWVGAGGFAGSIARYIVGLLTRQVVSGGGFPWATLTVNMAGCFVIGFLAALGEGRQLFTSGVRLFVFVGFLGGFTTFSAFSHDTVSLAQQGRTYIALANGVLQIVCGYALVVAGIGVAKLVRY